MARQTFVNLPVKDLAKATEFFTRLGFTFDQQFTSENATRMIVSDDTSVMLAVEPFFKEFIAPQGDRRYVEEQRGRRRFFGREQGTGRRSRRQGGRCRGSLLG